MLGALCVLGMVFGSLQTKLTSLGKSDPFHQLASFVVLPATGALGGGLDATRDFIDGITHARLLAAQNRAYQSIARSAELYTERLDELRRENDELRKQLRLPELVGHVRVPARIVGYFPAENRVILSAGAGQGVKAGMAVVAGDGLVGVVQSSTGSTSEVLLLSSPSLMVGAITERNPPSAGLLKGESASMAVIEFLDSSTPLDLNDLVVTSGFSERIPRGIPIGRIVQIDQSAEFGTRRSRVFLTVQIGAVREVSILR